MLPYQQPEIITYSHHMAASFSRWTGNVILARHCRSVDLVPMDGDPRFAQGAREDDVAYSLYHAPFVLLSHGIQADPVFCYANLAAQTLWNIPWETFVSMPSRLSAEPDAQGERERLLRRAEEQGYVDDYSGVRITSDGRRFRIRDCILWNVLDDNAQKIGQAAMFSEWEWL